MAVAHSQTRANAAKAAKASPRREAKGKERGEKAANKFDGECRYCQKRGQKKADCRKMDQTSLQASVTRVAGHLVSTHSQRQAQGSLHRKQAMHRA